MMSGLAMVGRMTLTVVNVTSTIYSTIAMFQHTAEALWCFRDGDILGGLMHTAGAIINGGFAALGVFGIKGSINIPKMPKGPWLTVSPRIAGGVAGGGGAVATTATLVWELNPELTRWIFRYLFPIIVTPAMGMGVAYATHPSDGLAI